MCFLTASGPMFLQLLGTPPSTKMSHCLRTTPTSLHARKAVPANPPSLLHLVVAKNLPEPRYASPTYPPQKHVAATANVLLTFHFVRLHIYIYMLRDALTCLPHHVGNIPTHLESFRQVHPKHFIVPRLLWQQSHLNELLGALRHAPFLNTLDISETFSLVVATSVFCLSSPFTISSDTFCCRYRDIQSNHPCQAHRPHNIVAATVSNIICETSSLLFPSTPSSLNESSSFTLFTKRLSSNKI